VSFVVPEEGEYLIECGYVRSPNHGIAQILIGDVNGGVSYQLDMSDGVEAFMERQYLQKGVNSVSIQCNSSSQGTSGTYMLFFSHFMTIIKDE
jgi:hypothetical protein